VGYFSKPELMIWSEPTEIEELDTQTYHGQISTAKIVPGGAMRAVPMGLFPGRLDAEGGPNKPLP
jgi:hypothetical protein